MGADLDLGPNLEEFQSNGAATGSSQFRSFESNLSNPMNQQVGQRRHPKSKLIGTEAGATGSIGVEIQLLLLVLALHVLDA